MKKLLFILIAGVILLPSLPAKADSDDGAPFYSETVEDSYRRLQYKMSVYLNPPVNGPGIRVGIYQAQAAYGKGATAKNMKRLEKAVELAKAYNVQLISFPELYVPGYTLSPEMAREIAEYKEGRSAGRSHF